MGPEAGMLILILLLLAAGAGIVLWNVLLYGGIAVSGSPTPPSFHMANEFG